MKTIQLIAKIIMLFLPKLYMLFGLVITTMALSEKWFMPWWITVIFSIIAFGIAMSDKSIFCMLWTPLLISWSCHVIFGTNIILLTVIPIVIFIILILLSDWDELMTHLGCK